MAYAFEIAPSCRESIDKACRKNPVLRNALTNKMNEILENPEHFQTPQRRACRGTQSSYT